MAALTADERAFFEASASLACDGDGRAVLRGLTHEETELYLQHWRAELHGQEACVPRSTFCALHQKHLDAVLGDMPRVA